MQKNVTTQEIADNKLAIILILKNGELFSFIKNGEEEMIQILPNIIHQKWGRRNDSNIA